MSRAFVLGGGGQVGHAVTRRLLQEGWEVTVASRSGRRVEGAAGVAVDRTEPDALAAALGDGVDLLVDCVCYDQEHAEQLLGVRDRVGRFVVLSSLSVYADEQGQSLDEARTPEEFPDFPVPVTEQQPTVLPGPATYSTRKVAMERRLLDQDEAAVTVLRPGAIHGPHSRHAREWFFVGRALDARPFVILAYSGRSRFHPTGVTNLAEAVLASSNQRGQAVFNLVDPDCPTVAEIGQHVADLMDHQRAEFLLPGPPEGPVGDSPWAVARPFVASSEAAIEQLGYAPVATYREQLADDVAWLLQATASKDWRLVLPDLVHNYPVDFFDYSAEEIYLQTHPGLAL